MALTPSKAELRIQMRDKRLKVSDAERKAAGKAVCERIFNDPIHLLTRAWRICIYLSTKNEIPTRYIARKVWEAERELCVPAWSKSEKTYKLYAVDQHTHFVTGHHGIREPKVRNRVMPWDVNAFILPGLAFDRYGARLGYGAGYYDQMLTKSISPTLKIALAYDWQILDQPLPQDPHDIAIDWLITDTQAINCAKQRVMRTNSLS